MQAEFRYLDDRQRRNIADAACDLLETVGVCLTEPDTREMLHGAGARVEGERVRIPAASVEAALASAPRAVTLYDRSGEACFRLDSHAAVFGGHTDGPELLDPFSGVRRPCVQADVLALARLVDVLPNISFTTASGMVCDRPAKVADRLAVAACLKGSIKPILAMPVTLAGLQDCHMLAALAVGGEDELRRHPLLVPYTEPVSPLVDPDESMRKLRYCARHAIPVVFSGYAAMGGTAPMSPAGIVAQLCAESLSGLVVHQLTTAGAPFIFGGMASVMDMRTTLFSYGAPEFVRGNMLMVEMAHHFELPCMGTAGTSDAQIVDGQALLEATSSCLLAILCRAGLVHDVGLLGSATLVSAELIVASDEIVGMLRRLVSGVATDAGAMAKQVIADVGPGGAFLTHDHTLQHFRDVWYPRLLFRGGARAWDAQRPVSYADRLNQETRRQMALPERVPLAGDVWADMEEVLDRAERLAAI